MKDYDDMNIFDIASLLNEMMNDSFDFEFLIDDKPFTISEVKVETGQIQLVSNRANEELISYADDDYKFKYLVNLIRDSRYDDNFFEKVVKGIEEYTKNDQ